MICDLINALAECDGDDIISLAAIVLFCSILIWWL